MAPTMRFPMFTDEVINSTELTRNTSGVLNLALKAPVTISRRNDQFALLSRPAAARMVRVIEACTLAFDHLQQVHAVKATHRASSSRYSWMEVYEKDDLEKFERELMSTASNVLSGDKEPSEMGELIHEWRESAVAIQSGLIDEALFESPESEETRLPSPSEVLEKSECLEPVG